MKPYTYLIKHKPTNKVYYGFRSANKVDPVDDLWTHYFTSSPGVKRLIEETGVDSFDVEIRKEFDTQEQAVAWESKVLRRMRVLESDRWLNQNVAGYIVPTAESNQKISDFHKGKPKSEEHKRNLSKANKGKKKPPVTDEYRKKMSIRKTGKGNARWGVKVAGTETAKKIGDANRGRPAHNKGIPSDLSAIQKMKETKARKTAEGWKKAAYELVTCPHCGKECPSNVYKRWHGDNCKSQK